MRTGTRQGCISISRIIIQGEIVRHHHHSGYCPARETGTVLSQRTVFRTSPAPATDHDQVIRVIILIKQVGPPTARNGIHTVLRLTDISPCVTPYTAGIPVMIRKKRRNGERKEHRLVSLIDHLRQIAQPIIIGFHGRRHAFCIIRISLHHTVTGKIQFQEPESLLLHFLNTGRNPCFRARMGRVQTHGSSQTIRFTVHFQETVFCRVLGASHFVAPSPPPGERSEIQSHRLTVFSAFLAQLYPLIG